MTLSDGKAGRYDLEYRGEYGIEDTRQALYESASRGHPRVLHHHRSRGPGLSARTCTARQLHGPRRCSQAAYPDFRYLPSNHQLIGNLCIAITAVPWQPLPSRRRRGAGRRAPSSVLSGTTIEARYKGRRFTSTGESMKLRYCCSRRCWLRAGACRSLLWPMGPMPPTARSGRHAPSNPAVERCARVDRLLAIGSEPKPPAQALAVFSIGDRTVLRFDYAFGRVRPVVVCSNNQQQDQQALVGRDQPELPDQRWRKSSVPTTASRCGSCRRVPAMTATAEVSAAVLNPGSYPARLDFRLYRSGNQLARLRRGGKRPGARSCTIISS